MEDLMNAAARILKFCLLMVFISSLQSVSAHHGAEASISGARLAGPIITLPALTLPRHKAFLGAGVNYTQVDRFSRTEIRRLNSRGIHSHNNGNILSPSISGGFGLTDNLTLIANLPYIFKYDLQSGVNGITLNQGNAIGLGDLTVTSQYRFYQRNGLHLAAIAGLKFPTGETDEEDSFGVKIAVDDQAGSGSWDPIMGLALSKVYDRISLHASGVYKLSTEGERDTVVGDLVNYGIAAAHRMEESDGFAYKLFPHHFFKKDLDWDIILELNGQWSENVQIGNTRDNNHGGNLLFLTPGLRMIYDDKWVTNIASSVTVFEDLSGFQSEPSVQLTFNISRIF